MEFGSFMEFPPVANGGENAAFEQALAEVEEAERVGLDAVWLAELHGAPERSVLHDTACYGHLPSGRSDHGDRGSTHE